MTKEKRKYTRLTPTAWAEIRALWETGETTLADLANQFGISTRALQSHFEKHNTAKGAKSSELVASIQKKVFDEQLDNPDLLAQRARDIREQTYANSVTLEDLIMAQLAQAQTDPTSALKAGSAIKMLSLAASGLERLHQMKLRALGLDKNPVLQSELPTITIVDLTDEEITELQRQPDDLECDDELMPSEESDETNAQREDDYDGDDDRIEEGAGTEKLDEDGCRLVREAA